MALKFHHYICLWPTIEKKRNCPTNLGENSNAERSSMRCGTVSKWLFTNKYTTASTEDEIYFLEL